MASSNGQFRSSPEAAERRSSPDPGHVRFGVAPRVNFRFGVVTSLLLHSLGIVIGIVALERSASQADAASQVFSVEIEGGMQLGGVNQTGKKDAKKILTREVNQDKSDFDEKKPPNEKEPVPEKKQPEEVKAEKKIVEPTVIDELKKQQEKKLLEEKKKEEEKKKLEEKKKKEEQEEKKREEQEKRDKQREREERNKKLADAMKKFDHRYEGPSSNAGGTGPGAAALGGNKMGGGTLVSLEKSAYMNALEAHVKSGWHSLTTTERLTAKVHASVQPTGEILDVRIVASSGNRAFDDSVVRAVLKASPAPAPPASLIADFKDVSFTFSSLD